MLPESVVFVLWHLNHAIHRRLQEFVSHPHQFSRDIGFKRVLEAEHILLKYPTDFGTF